MNKENTRNTTIIVGTKKKNKILFMECWKISNYDVCSLEGAS